MENVLKGKHIGFSHFREEYIEHIAKQQWDNELLRHLSWDALHPWGLEELSSHMMKEEQILFPMIKQGMGSQAMGPISVMESEHDEAGELLEVIKHTTNNVTPPPEACTTWKAMYNGINELIDDLMDHISLENNVLFPRALAGE